MLTSGTNGGCASLSSNNSQLIHENQGCERTASIESTSSVHPSRFFVFRSNSFPKISVTSGCNNSNTPALRPVFRPDCIPAMPSQAPAMAPLQWRLSTVPPSALQTVSVPASTRTHKRLTTTNPPATSNLYERRLQVPCMRANRQLKCVAERWSNEWRR